MKQSFIDLLTEINTNFNGRLIEHNIKDYIFKIYKTATIHSIKKKGKVIAFIAYYDNDTSYKKAFLTMLAVGGKYQNLGYGNELLQLAINNLKQKKFESLDLEVLKVNIKAISFYRKNNFQVIDDIGDKYLMRHFF